MRLFSNKKSLSRERVIGISLADILLQAVFLLFIALIVGYKDPQQLLLIQKFEQLGKDLCNKKNPDSLQECKEQEIIKDQQFIEVGKKLCEGKYKDNKKCIQEYLAAIKEKDGKASPCMPIDNKNWYAAVVFNVYSKDEIQFIKFTDEYENYLESRKDKIKLNFLNEIRKKQYTKFNRSELRSTFSFIKQVECFHKATYINQNKENMKQTDWSEAVNALHLR